MDNEELEKKLNQRLDNLEYFIDCLDTKIDDILSHVQSNSVTNESSFERKLREAEKLIGKRG